MRAIIGRERLDCFAASSSQMGRFETEWLASDANLETLADVLVSGSTGSTIASHLATSFSTWTVPRAQPMASRKARSGTVTSAPAITLCSCSISSATCRLRPGNVHSAENRRLVLEPVIARYRERGVALYFRADAAFAKPDRYRNRFGLPSYRKYRNAQIAGNTRKLDEQWIDENSIQWLSKIILREIGHPQFGLCHGTRWGKEQEWFAKYLGCNVLGTKISSTATKFPNTIKWGLHDVKKKWIANCDFVYSNSGITHMMLARCSKLGCPVCAQAVFWYSHTPKHKLSSLKLIHLE
jgi:hypothetical protein